MDKGPSLSAKNEAEPLIKKVDPEYFFDRYDMAKLLGGLRRHFLLVVLTALACGISGAFLTYRFITTYTAESILLYESGEAQKLGDTGITFNTVSLPTALDMIKLPAHLQAVKSILGLDLTTQDLDDMIVVPIPRGDSKLIRIVATGDNPNLVIDIANTLAKLAVKSSQEYQRRQLISTLESYRNKLDDAKQRLTVASQQIEDFKTKNAYFEMTADYATLLHEYNTTRDSLREAVSEYSSMLVEYENLRREFNSLPDKVPVSVETKGSPLQARIISLQASLAEAKSKYADTNPKVQKIQDELDLLTKSTGEQEQGNEMMQRNTLKETLEVELMRMQGKVRSSQKKKQDLSLRVSELEKKVQNLPKDQNAFSKLLHEKELVEQQIKDLNTSVDTVQLLLNVPKGSLETYQLAEKAKPLKDSTLVKLLPFVALIFGIGLGTFIALLLEMYDTHIWTAKQVTINYSIPCLAVFPVFRSLESHNFSEQMLFFIRRLAERLHQQLPGLTESIETEKALSVAITSSVATEGKSVLATALADYLSCIGKKVVLLEADYHPNPLLAPLQEGQISLEQYLHGEGKPASLIVHGTVDRVIAAHRDLQMKEMIKTTRMKSLWQELEKKYDVIIVDAPGVIQDDYCSNLATKCDLTVFVVGSPTSGKKLVDEALTDLDSYGIRPCGIVLNKVDSAYIHDERMKKELKGINKGVIKKFISWKS